jgi:hypothetical protein
MPYWCPIEPFYHLHIDCSEVRSVTTILPRLTQNQHHHCIEVQRKLITSLIREYGTGYFISYTLAVRLNYVWYKFLPELLSVEEMIYKVILEQISKQVCHFYTWILPDGLFKEVTGWRDDPSDNKSPPTPDLP